MVPKHISNLITFSCSRQHQCQCIDSNAYSLQNILRVDCYASDINMSTIMSFPTNLHIIKIGSSDPCDFFFLSFYQSCGRSGAEEGDKANVNPPHLGRNV